MNEYQEEFEMCCGLYGEYCVPCEELKDNSGAGGGITSEEGAGG